MSPIIRRMQRASLGEAISVVERMIEVAAERAVRDALVVRLAALDQYLSRLQDDCVITPDAPVYLGNRQF